MQAKSIEAIRKEAAKKEREACAAVAYEYAMESCPGTGGNCGDPRCLASRAIEGRILARSSDTKVSGEEGDFPDALDALGAIAICGRIGRLGERTDDRWVVVNVIRALAERAGLVLDEKDVAHVMTYGELEDGGRRDG